MKRCFVSTSVYALAHQLGMQGAIDEVKRQLDAPDKDSLPVVRTIARLRKLDIEVDLVVDGGATYIGMARSRMFHEAMKREVPWISLDDDVEVTTDCAAAMFAALEDIAPRIVLVPYYTRDQANPQLTITLPIVRDDHVRNGAKLLTLPKGQGGGFGMVGMNVLALRAVAAAAEEACMQWFDYGERKLAVFFEMLDEGFWHGEDTSFFKYRVPSEVTVEALLVGTVVHAGVGLRLDSL